MQLGIAQRMAKVSMVTGLSTVISIGLQFISVPICLYYWGNDTYGTWLALFAAFTLLRTIDSGYIGYTGNKLNMLYHRNEQELRLTLASAIWGVTFLGILQMLILMLLYITDTISFIINSKYGTMTIDETMLALSILSVSWVFSGSYIGIVQRLRIPTGMMYQSAWWSMGFQITQFITLIIAAIMKLSILQTALLFALIQAIVYIASAINIKLALPRYYPWWTEANWTVGFDNLLRSIPFTLSGILQQGGGSGMIMLISTLLSPAAIPAFATVRTLSNLWTNLINIITVPLLPDVVRLYEKKEGQKLLSVHQAHGLLIGLVVNLSILITYPFLGTIYSLWTNNGLLLDKSLLSLLLATVALAGMSALMNSFLSGINHLNFVLTTTALRGGLALILSLFLLPVYEIKGVGMAIFLAEIFVLLITVLWFFKRELTRITTKTKLASLGWSYLSLLSVTGYLLAECFQLSVNNTIYWYSLAGVITGNLLTWHKLDIGIKNRVKSLLYLGS